MKKALLALLALLLLASIVACGTQTSTEQLPTPTQTEAATTNVVAFADPALEAIVHDAMGKPNGEITVAEAKTVTSLSLAYAEWQKYVSEKEPISSIAGLENFTNLESLDLSGNAITDLAPLSVLTNLKALILTDCAAEDYTPLASLTNLRVLMLDQSTIADPTPLLTLTNLKCLYLEGSQIKNYFPLADIRANLELADFNVAYTLAELGFTFNDNDKMALYETDIYDIRINHVEWGDPPQQDWQNCIRVVIVTESGYKNAIGFYPVHNAYVAWLFNPDTQENYTYVYDVAENSFGCDDRASMEAIVREAFGDVNDEDVLLTPFVYFDNLIQEALGIPIGILCTMPYDESIALQSQDAISTDSSEETTDQPAQQPTVIGNGNAAANLFMDLEDAGAGLVARDGASLYFGNPNDGYRLYAAGQNGDSDLRNLLDISISYVNVVDQTIYYCDTKDDYSICSVGVDGQNQQKLANGHCKDLSYLDGWLYYHTASGIFRLPAEGGESEELLSGKLRCVYAYSDCVYYMEDNEGGGLWRISLGDGELQPLLTDHHTLSFAIQDDLLYCLIDGGDSVDVIRMNLDGTNQTEVYSVHEKLDAINISGDHLLILKDSGDGVHKTMLIWNLDQNKAETTIDDLAFSAAWCFDSDVYYITDSGLTRLNLDSGKRVLIGN
jgi:hypothetical protein